jgi:hypothetical protein
MLTAMDRGLSLSHGRPPGISENATLGQDTFIAELEDGGDVSFPSTPQIQSWIYQLSQIQNRFCNAITSSTFTASKLDSISRIDEALILWRDNLPLTCRPDHPILVDSSKHLLVLFLHLEYFNLLRSVHWAALSLQPCLAGSINNPTSRIRGSEILCVDAARSFIRALNRYVSSTYFAP